MSNKDQLQEIYFHLDGVNGGTQRIAWYGQLRAQELSHAEALEKTIEKYRLTEAEWYQSRLRHRAEREAKRVRVHIDLSRR